MKCFCFCLRFCFFLRLYSRDRIYHILERACFWQLEIFPICYCFYCHCPTDHNPFFCVFQKVVKCIQRRIYSICGIIDLCIGSICPQCDDRSRLYCRSTLIGCLRHIRPCSRCILEGCNFADFPILGYGNGFQCRCPIDQNRLLIQVGALRWCRSICCVVNLLCGRTQFHTSCNGQFSSWRWCGRCGRTLFDPIGEGAYRSCLSIHFCHCLDGKGTSWRSVDGDHRSFNTGICRGGSICCIIDLCSGHIRHQVDFRSIGYLCSICHIRSHPTCIFADLISKGHHFTGWFSIHDRICFYCHLWSSHTIQHQIRSWYDRWITAVCRITAICGIVNGCSAGSCKF